MPRVTIIIYKSEAPTSQFFKQLVTSYHELGCA